MSVPDGASLTGVTLKVMRVGGRIEIDAAVGRAAVVLHLERERRCSGEPLPLAAGVKMRLPAMISPAAITVPAVTALPDSVSVPAPGSVVILTACQHVGRRVVRIGEAEVGRREGVRRVLVVRDRVVGARRRVVDRSDVDRHACSRVGSRSTPPLAVPPSSCTWNVKRRVG